VSAATATLQKGSHPGLLRPDEVEDETGIELPEHDDYDTIAGLVLRVLGRVPMAGDVALVDLQGDPERPAVRRTARLHVERMDGRRIDRIRLTVEESADPEAGEDDA
jgi:CBS domain containing-hemolysin-like protein